MFQYYQNYVFKIIFKNFQNRFNGIFFYQKVSPYGIVLIMKTLCSWIFFIFIASMSHQYQSKPLSNMKLENKSFIQIRLVKSLNY